MPHHRKLFILGLILLFGAAFALSGRFELLFAFLVFMIIVFSVFYFFHDDNKLHHEALKREIKHYAEEQEAHKWLEHTFAPHTNRELKKKARTVSIFAGIIILLLVFFWTLTVSSLSNALVTTIITAFAYCIILVYLHYLPHLFARLPRTVRQYTNNSWGRGYLTFLPIVLILYLLSPYAAVSERGISVLLTLHYVFFLYTALFIVVYCFTFLAVPHEK